MKTQKIVLTLLLVLALPLHAAGISEFYIMALEHDPEWQAALKEHEAAGEQKNISRAGLLPKAALSYQTAPLNHQKREYHGVKAGSRQRSDYRSHSASLTVTQPLFDYSAWVTYKIGIVQTMMADERYRQKLIELASRVIGRYLDIVFAEEKLSLTRRHALLLDAQLTQSQQLMTAGEGSVTDVEETRAQLSLAEAEVIEAQDQLEDAQRELELIVGTPLSEIGVLAHLRTDSFPVTVLNPKKFEDWQQLAVQNNPQLKMSRHNASTAELEVERRRAGMLPQIQLYASHSLSDSASDSTVHQSFNTSSVGLQMSIQLFNGGETLAGMRQASATYGQIKYENELQQKKIFNQLKKNFNVCAQLPVRLMAWQHRLHSAATQLEATRKGVIAGQRVSLDVLDAENQLFQAKLDLLSAKFNYLRARVGLLSDAGLLDRNRIQEISAYFVVAGG